ncbi:predicted protein [Plenodomus lingam JN3]|uniref:Predicted protein n=1 Tax=Leptosphaeria maculans (strain JN3 / isolate v23.1.3 / race Av1-4-5-6-7-8) TaxID=985895 RepID=E4ZN72_LEPMJ|nr:predicted protein [Plenodomus lingam JN3]CBX92931.1 predicted protein [Plenodomus lingam JN3]
MQADMHIGSCLLRPHLYTASWVRECKFFDALRTLPLFAKIDALNLISGQQVLIQNFVVATWKIMQISHERSPPNTLAHPAFRISRQYANAAMGPGGHEAMDSVIYALCTSIA